jgi:hypothetical protein
VGPACSEKARPPRLLQQLRVDEHGLVIGRLTDCAASAVLGVQFGCQSSSREAGVEALLEPPGRILAVAIEPGTEAAMPDDVVHSAEPVERTALGTVKQGVLAIVIGLGGCDLEEAIAPDGRDELVRRVVRPRAGREPTRTASGRLGQVMAANSLSVSIASRA